jgi:5'-nucleotidase
VEALRVEVARLTSMGVNKIIALGHAGFDVDIDIAKRVKGVDVVIGGHSNTFLYTGRPIQLTCTLTWFKNWFQFWS